MQQISIDKLTWLLKDKQKIKKKIDIWNSNRDEDLILYEREKKQATDMFDLNEIKSGKTYVLGEEQDVRARMVAVSKFKLKRL